MIKHIPNILTICRFIFIPTIVIALGLNDYILAIILFTLSAFTDVLDGIIARKYNVISDFGKLMDPLADKCTQIAVVLTLTIKNIIPMWIIVVLIIKEVVLIAGASFLYGKKLVVSSKWYGKLSTVLIYLAVISSCLISQYNLSHFDVYLYGLAIIFAVFSLAMYINYFWKRGYLPKKEELKQKTESINKK